MLDSYYRPKRLKFLFRDSALFICLTNIVVYWLRISLETSLASGGYFTSRASTTITSASQAYQSKLWADKWIWAFQFHWISFISSPKVGHNFNLILSLLVANWFFLTSSLSFSPCPAYVSSGPLYTPVTFIFLTQNH